MPLILVHEANQPVRLFEVRTTRVRIGRGEDADLQLSNVAVSRRHAQLEHGSDGSVVLTPLSEKNPVVVDGDELQGPTPLSHGDRFRVGRYRLTWLHEDRLDTYRLHQLSEMPRHSNAPRRIEEETFTVSPELRRRYAELDDLRDRGSLISPDGTVYRLGSEAAEIGPGASIPCESRLGRWTAARLSWGGAGHVIERVGLFARVEVDGEIVSRQQMLAPGQKVLVNGTGFTYDVSAGSR